MIKKILNMFNNTTLKENHTISKSGDEELIDVEEVLDDDFNDGLPLFQDDKY
ncbi:MAG: hypothetical protein LPK00_00925 [Bacillaceae bacterium]|nr:hypothetical protein [Bacillaceae bacterium]